MQHLIIKNFLVTDLTHLGTRWRSRQTGNAVAYSRCDIVRKAHSCDGHSVHIPRAHLDCHLSALIHPPVDPPIRACNAKKAWACDTVHTFTCSP